jgi:uncharacterized Fe-S radical SAM superfamily protein PflX
MGKYLIWRTRLQRQEYNLNQHARQLDLHEAYLRRREHRCDCCEAEVHAARLSRWVGVVGVGQNSNYMLRTLSK